MQLWDLRPGGAALVERIAEGGPMGRRLMDLGLVPGTAVSCLGENGGRSLKAFCIRGAVIALRERDAGCVIVVEEGGCPWD